MKKREKQFPVAIDDPFCKIILQKLGFTLSTGTSTTTNSGGDANANSLSDEDLFSLIKRELGSILATIENVNDKVFDWIHVSYSTKC